MRAGEKREVIDIITLKAEYDASLLTLDEKAKKHNEQVKANKELSRREKRDAKRLVLTEKKYFRKPIRAKKGIKGNWLPLRLKVINTATDKPVIRTAKYIFREADIEVAENLVKCRFEYWNASHIAHANDLMKQLRSSLNHTEEVRKALREAKRDVGSKASYESEEHYQDVLRRSMNRKVKDLRAKGVMVSEDSLKDYGLFTNRKMRERHGDNTNQAHPGAQDLLKVKKDKEFDRVWHDKQLADAKEKTRQAQIKRNRREGQLKRRGKSSVAPELTGNYLDYLRATSLHFADTETFEKE